MIANPFKDSEAKHRDKKTTMAKSRISRFESEPLDPAIGLQHWDSIDFPDPATTNNTPYLDPTAFNSYQPHHQHQQVASPEISPPLRSQNWGRTGAPRVVSMVSPQSPAFPRTATSGPLGYSPLDANGGPRLSTLISDLPASSNVGPTGFSTDRNSTYSIPPPPKPPTIPMNIDDDYQDYERYKTSRHSAIDHEGPYNRGSTPGGLGANLGANLGRDKSLARRVSARVISAVRGRPKSTWGYGGVGGEAIDEESQAMKSGGYRKVDEVDEGHELPIGFDLDFFTAEHVPAAAVQAMQDHKMDGDMVYTGECPWVREVVSMF